MGSFALLFLLLFLVSRGLKIASNSKDRGGEVLAIGVSAMIFWQAFINIGMVVGMVPVVGVPLPLFQLWRNLSDNDPDRHWDSDERQHASVHVEPLRGHPHRETGDSPQVLRFSILRILLLSFFF